MKSQIASITEENKELLEKIRHMEITHGNDAFRMSKLEEDNKRMTGQLEAFGKMRDCLFELLKNASL